MRRDWKLLDGQLVLSFEVRNRTDAAVVFKRVDHRTGATTFVYHGNDGTSFPWNDTAQLDYLREEVREAVIGQILEVARRFNVIRFDAAMVLARRHIQRLWYPLPGHEAGIPSRSVAAVPADEMRRLMPQEFWREVVDRVAAEVPDTLLLAEAFWLMEGYFVRTLGMHRVYNSAFMHMLRDEKNAEYQQVVRETVSFDARILGRYVNFMNNPDEATAVEQFDKGDKYFGVATLLVTLPGLPMFGHGQVEVSIPIDVFQSYGVCEVGVTCYVSTRKKGPTAVIKVQAIGRILHCVAAHVVQIDVHVVVEVGGDGFPGVANFDDDDRADRFMNHAFESFFAAVDGRPNGRGGTVHINMLPTTCHVYFGSITGATPDGRHAGRPLSEGISPVQGADRLGPTAVLQSAAKMDHVRTGGTLLNMKFAPSLLEGDGGLATLSNLVRSYFKMDGHHVQFNVVDTRTLRLAQEHPDDYRNLLVRVAGYTAYFTELGKDVQDEIIGRTVVRDISSA